MQQQQEIARENPQSLAGNLGGFAQPPTGAGVAQCATNSPRRPTSADLRMAVMEGAVERVRPKMMTVVAIMAGLLPIMWSVGAGSEVMRRIAAPMVGGMISSTILTLIVIPALYALVEGRRLGSHV